MENKNEIIERLEWCLAELLAESNKPTFTESFWEINFTALWNERARWTKRQPSIQRTDRLKQLTIALNRVRTCRDKAAE